MTIGKEVTLPEKELEQKKKKKKKEKKKKKRALLSWRANRNVPRGNPRRTVFQTNLVTICIIGQLERIPASVCTPNLRDYGDSDFVWSLKVSWRLANTSCSQNLFFLIKGNNLSAHFYPRSKKTL